MKFALFSHELQAVELMLYTVYTLMTLGHRVSLSVQKKFRSSGAFSLSGNHKVHQFWHLKMDNAEKMGHSARYHIFRQMRIARHILCFTVNEWKPNNMPSDSSSSFSDVKY